MPVKPIFIVLPCRPRGHTKPTEAEGQGVATAAPAEGPFVWSQASIPFFSIPAQAVRPGPRHTPGLTLTQLDEGAGL